MTNIDKKLVIGIIFIVLILISGIGLIIFNDSSDGPEIIEDDELTESEIANNINEQQTTYDSYEITKDISLSPLNSSSNNIDINTQRTYTNSLNDSYIDTTIEYNGNRSTVELYTFDDTQYSSINENSWDVNTNTEIMQLFEYVNIINENNINNYNISSNEENYTIKSNTDDKAIDLINNMLTDKEKELINENFTFTNAQNTNYNLTVNEDYIIKYISINSEVEKSNQTYEAEIQLSNFNQNADSIVLPDELSSDDNIESNTYYSFINISQTTGNDVEITIEEDVSDMVESINIITRENEFSLNGQEGESISLSAGEDYNAEIPNININALMNSGDTRVVAEYKVSDTIDTTD